MAGAKTRPCLTAAPNSRSAVLPELPPPRALPEPELWPSTPEAICAALAPSIDTEAKMTAILQNVEPEKRDAIEACLRANGACRSVAGTV